MTASRKRRITTAVAAAGVLSLAGTAATYAASPAASHHGTIRFWVTPGHGAVDQILITGAIGDYGKATSIDKDGKVDQNGDYVKVALKHGGFRVNAKSFNDKAAKQQPHLDAATCSAWLTPTGSITLYDGYGNYAGISGKLSITTSYAFIGSRYKSGPHKGQCNVNGNAEPVAEFSGSITGSGKASWNG